LWLQVWFQECFAPGKRNVTTNHKPNSKPTWLTTWETTRIRNRRSSPDEASRMATMVWPLYNPCREISPVIWPLEGSIGLCYDSHTLLPYGSKSLLGRYSTPKIKPHCLRR
jgi:hypothetical protein